ncbi:MAG: single-stranded DNA-binding protein [Kiritimatiellaeota bacterium]|nr:single-stranded DNA-binding protein [Kiritimatiellota bacterium]
MMVSLNRVFLAGNLTRDPEVRYTPTGTAVGDLNLAVNRTYLSEGQQKKETCFIGVIVWGRLAEGCREQLSKGSPVLVEGLLQFDQWQTEGGEKHSRHLVRADRVEFLGGPRGALGDAPAGAGAAAAPAAAGAEPAAPGRTAGNSDDLPF